MTSHRAAVAPSVTWAQALAWRMERQLLDPVGPASAVDVVRRLCGVQAQVASSAELAVRVRSSDGEPGQVTAALADGRLVKTWAMRGTLHLLTPDEAGAFLSLLATGRTWELPSWQRYFGMAPRHWELFRPAVREALADGPLSREQLVAAVVATPGLEHVGDALRSGWGSLLKPLAWQGDLVYGPGDGTRVTFTLPAAASPGWGGIPDPADAAPVAIRAYLGAYGPATVEGFANWLSRGRVNKRTMRGWFSSVGSELAEVDVEGQRGFVPAELLDGLVAARPRAPVRLLPGFDQWVLGPGTEDEHVVPPGRRWDVSRQAGWIAPVVVAGGVVRGTWELDGAAITVSWFRESGAPPRSALEEQTARLATILGRPLTPEIRIA